MSEVVQDATQASLELRYDFRDGHRGVTALLFYLHMRQIRPDLLHVRGAYAQSLLEGNILQLLPTELDIEGMDNISAIRSLQSNMQDRQLQSLAKFSRSPGFDKKLGKLDILQYGPSPLDVCLVFVDHGTDLVETHRQEFEGRRKQFLKMKLLLTIRCVESHATRYPWCPSTPEHRRAYLQTVLCQVEAKLSQSGIDISLNRAIVDYRLLEAGYHALFRKQINNRHSAVKRIRTNRDRDQPRSRYDGLITRGEPGSKERQDQMKALIEQEEIAIALGREPPVLWKGRRPSEFKHDFEKLPVDHSIMRSNNAYGVTNEGRGARQAAGKVLGRAKHTKYQEGRATDAAGFEGGWVEAETLKMIQKYIKDVEGDHSDNQFQECPRDGVCKECDGLLIGKNRLSEHYCGVDSNAKLFSGEHCSEYSWALHTHDIFDHRKLPSIKEHALKAVEYTEHPAADLLLINGKPDPRIPFPCDPSKDIALRELCIAYDPIEMARKKGGIIDGAEEKHLNHREWLWNKRFPDHFGKVVGGEKPKGKTKSTTESKSKITPDPVVWLCRRCGYFMVVSEQTQDSQASRILLYRAFRKENGNSDLKKALLRWKEKNIYVFVLNCIAFAVVIEPKLRRTWTCETPGVTAELHFNHDID
ncbi:hypothetical protein CPB86DRAFT_826091 [Serendipita vermifera]|nr:hypothetical protein CPB86DRAFT_826091 [Serendipita vermifera]